MTAGYSNPDALKAVVLISGTGSNLKALTDAVESGKLKLDIVRVVSNRAEAGGIEYARTANIPVSVISHQDYTDREAHDAAVAELDAVEQTLTSAELVLGAIAARDAETGYVMSDKETTGTMTPYHCLGAPPDPEGNRWEHRELDSFPFERSGRLCPGRGDGGSGGRMTRNETQLMLAAVRRLLSALSPTASS